LKMVPVDLLPEHKPCFLEYLSIFSGCRLSAYAAENIYIWSGLYRIRWAIFKDCFCVFFEDKNGRFLYLPPLGKEEESRREAASRSFLYMREKNGDAAGVGRMENVPGEMLVSFGEAYRARPSMREYICSRDDLTGLRGNAFKHKRACCNHFAGNYGYEYRDFRFASHKEIHELYGTWAGQRRKRKDKVYDGMIADSRLALDRVLSASGVLAYRGGALFVEGKLKGFTLGYPLNADTFCVLYEFTDLSCKGAAQFIFREFCRSLDGYRSINVMDDSGLENLRRVKMSYRPREIVQAYSVFPAGA